MKASFEDLAEFVNELFAVWNQPVPPALTESEERALHQAATWMVPQDLDVLRRYRRLSRGRLHPHKLPVVHTLRRDLYLKDLAGELAKAQEYFDSLPPSPSPEIPVA